MAARLLLVVEFDKAQPYVESLGVVTAPARAMTTAPSRAWR